MDSDKPERIRAGLACDAREISESNQIASEGEGHRLETAMDTKLGEDVVDVVSCGRRVDSEFLGNGFG